MKTLEEITDPVGARTYSPDEEIARKAPAVICAVASRTLRLRARLEEYRENETFTFKDMEDLVRDFIAPLPFETDLLSGNLPRIDEVMRRYHL